LGHHALSSYGWVKCIRNMYSPRLGADELLGLGEERAGPAAVHGVALQVAFERQTLKPVLHLIGYRLWV
jgi:hypothetical protein